MYSSNGNKNKLIKKKRFNYKIFTNMYSWFKVTQRNGIRIKVKQFIPSGNRGLTEVHYRTEFSRKQVRNQGVRTGVTGGVASLRRGKVIELFDAKQDRLQNYLAKPSILVPKIRAVRSETQEAALANHNKQKELYSIRQDSIESNDGSVTGIEKEVKALEAYNEKVFGLKSPSKQGFDKNRSGMAVISTPQCDPSYPKGGQGQFALQGVPTGIDNQSYGAKGTPYVASVRQELYATYGKPPIGAKQRKAKGYSFKLGNRLVV